MQGAGGAIGLQERFAAMNSVAQYVGLDEKQLYQAVKEIVGRELPGGGFGYSNADVFSPEATAWAILALKASDVYPEMAQRACEALAGYQLSDGRVSAVKEYAAAAWPTPLCILAWRCLPGFRPQMDAALDFLLSFKGRHTPKPTGSPAGHDTSIVGWPWVEQTHSWIEPTCLAIMALQASGYGDHPRTREAARMIMDRQLAAGGWNYGNTTVFGQDLLPIPENSGQALCALSGMTDLSSVKKSLDYLVQCIRRIRTPMALSWMLHGLGMWGRLPRYWKQYVVESLALQARYGLYDTVLLAQLVTAYFTDARLIRILV
jgi:hypothetical protein